MSLKKQSNMLCRKKFGQEMFVYIRSKMFCEKKVQKYQVQKCHGKKLKSKYIGVKDLIENMSGKKKDKIFS